MTVTEWKVSVIRSNPQIIRQFLIDSNATVSDLRKLIQCVFQLQNKVTGALIGPSSQGEATTMAELSAAGTLWSFCEDGHLPLAFRLEYLSSEERPDLEIPMVTRAVGLNIPDRFCRNTKELNYIMGTWESNFAAYVQDEGYVRPDEFQYLPLETEHAIRRAFAPDTLPQEIYWKRMIPYERFLAALTVDDLKNTIAHYTPWISRNRSKQYLIENLTTEMCDYDQIISLFFEMSPDEYQTMENLICSSKVSEIGNLRSAFPVLASVHMIGKGNRGSILLPLELGKVYEKWRLTEEGMDHLAYLCFLRMMRACLNLYAIFTKDEALAVWIQCYPEYSAELFERYWSGGSMDDELDDPEADIDYLDHLTFNIVYNTKCFEESLVLKAWKSILADAGPCYIPSREELSELEKGIFFEPKGKAAISKFMQKQFYIQPDTADYLTDNLSVHIHGGADMEEMLNYLSGFYTIRKNSKTTAELVRLLQQYAPNVRRYRLRGFKPTERGLEGTV